ncbi:MAG: amino-acid N-acetyltransferase [Verrucomicrobiae bacterium]|nr:amino-acid N-acetyltransferase [Verrucomicrobiae bacterium]
MKATDLRAILQYIPQFRDKVFLISIDGAIVEDDNFTNLMQDIAVMRSLSIKVVVVHGAGHQIRKLSEQTGQPITDHDGTGVTDATTLNIALTAANRLTHEIIEGFTANGLYAAYANCIKASPMGIIHGKDYLLTGKIERVDTELLNSLLEKNITPILPPLGFDSDGKTYRLNSDTVAVDVSEALKAVKLLFLTTIEGIHMNGKLVRQTLVRDLEGALKQHRDWFLPEEFSKVSHGVKACQSGVNRVHIIDGRVDEGLLAEVFSNEGIGTLIYANEYRQIRPARKKDISNILKLIKQSIQQDELLRRTRSDIEKQLADYHVFEIDSNLVGCVAIHTFPELKKAELACLYVHHSHENQGIGRKLIQFVDDTAREKGFETLYALSTQAFTYFTQKAGYKEGTVADMPPVRREKFEQQGRKSKILIKSLTA